MKNKRILLLFAYPSQHRSEVNAAMSTARMDNHSRGERGWTPPPKGYENKFDE